MIVVDESEPVGGKWCNLNYQTSEVLHSFFYLKNEKKINNKTEIEPPFESRDVQIRRGLNVRDFFEMEEEIGRYEYSLYSLFFRLFFL